MKVERRLASNHDDAAFVSLVSFLPLGSTRRVHVVPLYGAVVKGDHI